MHGLAFRASPPFWQNQPGIYLKSSPVYFNISTEDRRAPLPSKRQSSLAHACHPARPPVEDARAPLHTASTRPPRTENTLAPAQKLSPGRLTRTLVHYTAPTGPPPNFTKSAPGRPRGGPHNKGRGGVLPSDPNKRSWRVIFPNRLFNFLNIFRKKY